MNSSDFSVASIPDWTQADGCVDLAIVLPTYNERENIVEVIAAIEEALQGLRWELIVVDDDSPDGTADIVRGYARRNDRIRLLHRVGRRGLSSACIEGIMATSANYVAVMDADMQHDETILPKMLTQLLEQSLDIVVGTRNAQGGSMGQFCSKRIWLSKLGQRIGYAVCHCKLSDPMSGFFLLRRSFFLEVVHHLQGNGFKILVDILSSSVRPVCLGEVGYCFRNRKHGDSKLDVNTAVEYLFLIIGKLTGGFVPVRFVIFSLVGAIGLATHLICLALLLYAFHLHFFVAQAMATFVAMTENFFVNNLITYRDKSLRGLRLLSGLASFWLACSFGAWANVIFARSLLQSGVPWYLSGIAGIILSSVWNYSISQLFTWQMPQPYRQRTMAEPIEALSGNLEQLR